MDLSFNGSSFRLFRLGFPGSSVWISVSSSFNVFRKISSPSSSFLKVLVHVHYGSPLFVGFRRLRLLDPSSVVWRLFICLVFDGSLIMLDRYGSVSRIKRVGGKVDGLVCSLKDHVGSLLILDEGW